MRRNTGLSSSATTKAFATGRASRKARPSRAMRSGAGDFSGLRDPQTGQPVPLINYLSGQPFPNNQIPATVAERDGAQAWCSSIRTPMRDRIFS